MAGTVAASVTLSVRNGDMNDNISLNCSGVVQTTQGKAAGIQVVGTTHEALDVGLVSLQNVTNDSEPRPTLIVGRWAP